jgi:AbrB family looped-hinge helix DNA binding protein
MVRYSKPVWQMVKEAVEKLGIVTAKDVKEYIRENYSQDNVNELTINAQVIACSVNHTSAHHYPDTKRFLFYLGNGRYRMYDPDQDGIWKMTPSGARKVSEEIKSGEAYFSQIGSGGQVLLPNAIRQKLSIEENDFVAFAEDNEGNIILKKAELRVIN